MSEFVSHCERDFHLAEIRVQLGFTEERAHETLHAHGGIQRVQKRFFHMLPRPESRVSILREIRRIELLDGRFELIPFKRHLRQRRAVQILRIVRQETGKRPLVVGSRLNIHPGVKRRAEIVRPPPYIHPDDEAQRGKDSLPQPVPETLILGDGDNQDDEQRQDIGADDDLLEGERKPGRGEGQGRGNDGIKVLRVKIRERRMEPASDDECQQNQVEPVRFTHVIDVSGHKYNKKLPSPQPIIEQL